MEKRFPARPALLALSSKFQLLAVVFLDADDRLSGAGTLAWPCRAGADQRRSSFLEAFKSPYSTLTYLCPSLPHLRYAICSFHSVVSRCILTSSESIYTDFHMYAEYGPTWHSVLSPVDS
ncbi:hypothetical protein C8Q70DRAFT_270558 [Cubamyces menziesii]|nr:hypothetical protein C8Q70DRAFT_270558 [Cubamyces menziesii]